MNLQQLKYVVAVANNGSFREAAKKMFITQPSLSNGIKELEQEIGLTLFTRTNKGAYLTEEGKDFLEHAEKILSQMEHLETRYQKSEQKERFSVAAQHYDFLGPIVAKLMKEFQPQYKQFRIFETTTAKVIEEVQQFASDIGLLYLNEHNQASIYRYLEQADLDYEILGSFQTHIFLGPQHPLANKEGIQLNELADYPQVRFTQDGQNFAYFYEDLIEIPEQETVFYTSDRGTLLNLLLETEAYASGSGIVVGGSREQVRLIPLIDAPKNKFCLIYPKRKKRTPIVETFVKEVKGLL
ncbi:LysR family transcriptional regulator [Enterococcus sp. JM4C]|uniref:LysR family transcriptional regulator n=1 Tax=Candidatus Enterococcus huntleyi TaxID=1857217 RepID=UPI00137B2A11|nr:LysR family transcriptional regulator [Enterococcus sp. JM4C]KAF1296069.1 LysR family transcriptional regulator [Enterococcus sp. JM4C]